MISTLVSLYEESVRSVLDRPLVFHAHAEDTTSEKNAEVEFNSERYLACGLIHTTDKDFSEIFPRTEKTEEVNQIEDGILNGGKTWENVRHPYYGASVLNVTESKFNFQQIALKNGAPTPKSMKFSVMHSIKVTTIQR